MDALRILQGERPIFFSTNFGREALFSYLVAVSFSLLGPGTLAIHVTSAVVGILTVPAVYLLASEVFGEQGPLSRFGGLLAALVVALSYWHLNWSRYGVRAILVPLFAATTLFLFWRGVRTAGRWSLVGCGVSLGLAMYTYQAARLLPLLVMLGLMGVAWRGHVGSRRDLAVSGLFILAVAAVVFAPLGIYFFTHPGSFGGRIDQALVTAEADTPAEGAGAFLDQVARVLLLFVFCGDDEPFSTIPGRPLLNPFLSVAFLAGLGVSLARIKRPRTLVLVAWLGLMSVPAMLARYAPAAKRAIGALPAVAMLAAIGMLVPYGWLDRQSAHRRWARRLKAPFVVALVLGLLYTGIATYRDYFVIWAEDPDLFTHFEVGLSAIGDYVGGLPAGERVYVSPPPPDHPGIVLHAGQREGIKGYNGRACLVLPPRASARDTTYVIVSGEDTRSLDALAAFFPQGGIAGEGPVHYYEPYFLAYRVPAGAEARAEPAHRVLVNWDDALELWGYDLDTGEVTPGDTVRLTLYYRALRATGVDYTVFTQLWGPHNPATGGPVWGQDDSEPCRRGYPTSVWDAGEIVIDRYKIPVSPSATAGVYEIVVGLYRWPSLERLPVLDAADQAVVDQAVVIGHVRVVVRE